MRRATGGTKEFHYTKEDLDRIRKTDTESTKKFKEAYKHWEMNQRIRKEEQAFEKELGKQKMRMIGMLVGLLVVLGILLFLRFMQ